MSLFFSPAAPADPSGLILSPAQAARQASLRDLRVRLAGSAAARLLLPRPRPSA